MNFIEEIYFNNIEPRALPYKYEDEFMEMCEMIKENKALLEPVLEGENKHLFSQMMNAIQEVIEVTEKEAFMGGWKMGAKCIFDSLS